MNQPDEPHFTPPSIPISPEDHRALAEKGNALLFAHYESRVPRWTKALRAAAHAGDGAELAKIARAYRLHGLKLSEFNIWAGAHASDTLLKLEEYFQSAAQDIESRLAPVSGEDTSGEEWKRGE